MDQMRAVVVSPAARPPSASRRPAAASSTVRETPTGRCITAVTETLTVVGTVARAVGRSDDRWVGVVGADVLGAAPALHPHSTRPAATSAAAARDLTW